MRLACFAKRKSWVTMMMVEPYSWSSPRSSITASPFFVSRLPVGSSAKRIEGSPASARVSQGKNWGCSRPRIGTPSRRAAGEPPRTKSNALGSL